MKYLSVSALNTQIQSLVESTFIEVFVEGEVSNLTKHSSGHYYFSIKDKASSIRCVMFRGNVSKVKFDLQNTQKILVRGNISVYVPRGEYQILCLSIEPSGQGALHFAYEQLKQRLQEKGFFEAGHKKTLPKFPKKIALVTSNTGAALQDMLRVAHNRWNLVKLVNIDTLVQGDEAKNHIAQSIKFADSFFETNEAFDVIVLARGGGSLEDLWAFNEEIVAQAIFDAKTPIVSAIGHEIDYVISDFVADMRAPTPSAAMEMILPDRNTWMINISNLYDDILFQTQKIFNQLHKQVRDYSFFLRQHQIENKLQANQKQLLELQEILLSKIESFLLGKNPLILKEQLNFYFKNFLAKKELVYKEILAELKSKDLDDLCQNGFAQIMHQNKIVSLDKLHIGDEVEIVSTRMQVKATINEIITKP